MDLSSIMQPTTLLVVGLGLLIVNIVYGLLRASRGNLKAGWFTVLLALLACVVFTLGTVQSANAAVATQGGRFPGGGAGRNFGSGNGGPGGFSLTATAQAAASAGGSTSDSSVAAPTADSAAGDASGSAGTPQAAGTPRGRSQGGSGSGGQGTTGGGQGGNAAGRTGGNANPSGAGGPSASGNTASTTGSTGTGGTGANGAASGSNRFGTGGGGSGRGGNFAGGAGGQANAAPPSQSAPIVAGAILSVILSLVLYFMERNRNGYAGNKSRGLLNLGAAVLVLVAALVIPMIPAQAAAAAAASRFADFAQRNPRAAVQPTASPTPEPTAAPTDLPSLTPPPSDTPAALPTQITYQSALTSQQSVCSGTATQGLALRMDSSQNQPAIGLVVAGSFLSVKGRTADNRWLQVTTNDATASVQGWVDSSYVKLSSACDSIPVVATSTPTTNPKATTLAAGSKAATATVTPAPCVLVTNTAVSMRGDPSQAHPPVASIPANTALNPTGKSRDGYWWSVSYGSAQGWIGNGAVLASSSCATMPVITATP